MENFIESSRLAEIYAALVNKHHGIISNLIEEHENPDARGLFVFNSLAIEASYFRENCWSKQQEARNGSGAAFDRTTALWATFGETLERYSAFIYDTERLVYATEEELNGTAVPLSDFILFGEEQYEDLEFPFFPANPNLKQYWIAADDCSEPGTKKYVPATMIFLGLKLGNMQENIAQSASTGLSCGSNPEDTIRGGLCEVIERDAFSAMWQLKYAPPKLDIDDKVFAQLHPGVQAALQQKRTQIHLWSITTDTGIPVIMSMAENTVEGLLAFGSAANPDGVRAINKAVIEALHGLVWSHRVRNRGKPLPTLEQISNPTDHFSYYLDPARRPLLHFLFENPHRASTASFLTRPATVAEMTRHLASIGYRTYAVDVTTEDVHHLGLQVSRVIVPGLHPLLFGGRMISLDERRLRKIATHWGMSEFPATNPLPHPFP